MQFLYYYISLFAPWKISFEKLIPPLVILFGINIIKNKITLYSIAYCDLCVGGWVLSHFSASPLDLCVFIKLIYSVCYARRH